GYACEMDCTRSITKDNPSHRYLLSPKENLYDTLLGEKVGFLQNVASAQYEESSVLKEMYKTKNNYLTSFINAKIDTWQDTIIRMDQQETIIEYTVNIDLGQEYLEMIRSSLEDEEYLEVLDAQINGNIPYVQNIIRKDTITIDANGYLKERDSKYTIVDSREEAHSIEFEDIVDISKVLDFNFTYAETAVNETIEYLIGTYSFIRPDGTLRSLSFSNSSAWIEESGKTTMCSYSLKNGILKLNLMDENGNIIKTEKYQVSADYSYLTDSNGNNYTYVIQTEEVYEQYFDFSYSDSIEDDVSEELPEDLETSQED
ncbi:MAG: hypothetical protein KBT48_00580, partial [Firmicutes bacterium]|nr:hypothetical protein [Bacillota bacterium]